MANPTARVEITNLNTEPVTCVLRGDKVMLEAHVALEGPWAKDADYNVTLSIDQQLVDQDLTLQVGREAANTAKSFKPGNSKVLQVQAELDTAQMPPGPHEVTLSVSDENGNPLGQGTARFIVQPRAGAVGPHYNSQVIVSKNVVATNWTDDAILSLLIKKSTKDLEFKSYKAHMDWLLCGQTDNNELDTCVNRLFQGPDRPQRNDPRQRPLVNRRFLPFNDTDAYRLLKIATEAFVAVKSAVNPLTFKKCLCQSEGDKALLQDAGVIETARAINALVNLPASPTQQFQQEYLQDLEPGKKILPYLALLRQKLRDQPLKDEIFPNMGYLIGEVGAQLDRCTGLIRYKLTCPIMIELIWSYWHEQGMHAQTLYAIRDRFQNRRSGPAPDPLAAMEIGVLRPLNNILWGYIQDEQHRLTITRRCYEYDHHYGVTLQGKAVPKAA